MTPSFKADRYFLSAFFCYKRFFCIVFVCANLHTLTEYKEYDGCYLGHYALWFFWSSLRLVSLWLQEESG